MANKSKKAMEQPKPPQSLQLKDGSLSFRRQGTRPLDDHREGRGLVVDDER
jgi:hypothetical protein